MPTPTDPAADASLQGYADATAIIAQLVEVAQATGRTQTALAAAAGVSQPTLRAILHSETGQPKFHVVTAMARSLGLRITCVPASASDQADAAT